MSPQIGRAEPDRGRQDERRAHASCQPAGRTDGEHHERRDEEDPDDAHREGDRHRGERGERDVQGADRHSRDPRSLLVDDDGCERPVEKRDRGEAQPAEQRDREEVASRDREDRPEQVLEEVDVERARLRDEDHPERDPRVEDERERLIAGSTASRAEELDCDPSYDGEDEGRQHGRDVEEDPRGHSGERDVTDAVAEERLPALHEKEAHGRREHADDRARREGEPHELTLEHERARGRATCRGGRGASRRRRSSAGRGRAARRGARRRRTRARHRRS